MFYGSLFVTLRLTNVFTIVSYNKNEGKAHKPAIERNRDIQPRGTAALLSVSADDVMFVNVEAVPELASTSYLSASMQRFWEAMPRPDGVSPDEAYAAMGHCAEFGRVACVTVGVIRTRKPDDTPYFITSSYVSDDERSPLCDFAEVLDNFFSQQARGHFVCGHNILRSEIPFFARRLVINRLRLPALFDYHGRRKLADNVIDTADFWAMSDFASLRVDAPLLASVLGVDADPDDYDPARAAELFHQDNDLDAIARRSERKVFTSAQIFRSIRNESLILSDHFIRKD